MGFHKKKKSLLTTPVHHCWTFIHRWDIVRSWVLSLLPSYGSFFSFLIFLVITLFLWHFWSRFLNKMLGEKLKGQEVKMTSAVSHLPTFYFLLNASFIFFIFYFYFLQKLLMGGQTNVVYLPLFYFSFLFFWFLIFVLIS